jgi:transaldolase
MNPLLALGQQGQFVWLDNISRRLIRGGGLARLIAEDGLGGVTSNPTIFAKAIGGGADYDAGLERDLAAEPGITDGALAERLIVEDIQAAAELLCPVHDASGGANGFVSIEVSPGSAHDTGATLAEARRLWRAVARPNVMIKVPATTEGVRAVEELTAEGVNVNITLMFSLAHYEAVAQAYLRGIARHADPHRVTSVASVFVSRLDVVADRRLEEIGSPEALALRGTLAIANARRVYARFHELFFGEPFAALARKGARVQRPLWASTGTKNPAYSDVLYLEALIGPATITTVPPATLDAFRDHGRVQTTLGTEEDRQAERAAAAATRLGIDIDAMGERLLADGLDAFAASFDELLATIAQKRRRLGRRRADAGAVS